MVNRFIIEDARRLGFRLTIEYGAIRRDFQYLGYQFVKGGLEDWRKKNGKIYK